MKKKAKKLLLNSETVRHLGHTEPQLRVAKGGTGSETDMLNSCICHQTWVGTCWC